ncbi:creatininase family protein, partial [Salmonella enterica subsp. enterica serovar Java]|nr:creatininase family protein [Salmonella enterica subsp. enterica serovar Java]ECB7405162.1 creatininase family protein [Salmonella enterica subsp. enterica serovar Java]
MQIQHMNWFQVEETVKQDNRVILPLGSTEQ